MSWDTLTATPRERRGTGHRHDHSAAARHGVSSDAGPVTTHVVTLQTVHEELANSLTHGVGFLLSVAGLVSLVVLTSVHGTFWQMVGCTIFGVSLVMLYLASTLYHAISNSRLKQVMRNLDHVSIYLLIAGTYTPFTLISMGGAWGWTLFAVVWGLALLGILLKFISWHRHERWSLGVYLTMGWAGIIAVKPMFELLPAGAMFLLLAGGIAYTAGTYFYAKDTAIPYAHAVWHLFVIAGSALHFCAVIFYVVPSI
jgi:hemolysin III